MPPGATCTNTGAMACGTCYEGYYLDAMNQCQGTCSIIFTARNGLFALPYPDSDYDHNFYLIPVAVGVKIPQVQCSHLAFMEFLENMVK